MQQRTWVCRSRSEKYQCPLDHALHPTTSPRIHTGMNPPSTSRLVAVTSWVTDQTSSVGGSAELKERAICVLLRLLVGSCAPPPQLLTTRHEARRAEACPDGVHNMCFFVAFVSFVPSW